MDQAQSAKLASMFILGLSALAATLLPIGVTKWVSPKGVRADNQWVQLMLRLGGGVLLATTLLHLLPEVREAYEQVDHSDKWPENLPELITCVGFFMMYLVEEAAHILLHRRHASHHHRHHDDEHSHVVRGSPMRGLLIVIAVSLHQVFEGLAIGLESSAKHVWVLLLAVAIHKVVIALCVGIELASNPPSTVATIVSVATFALASPIGIGSGLALTSTNRSLDVASVVLQGLATGTLLYVVFFEVLTKTHEKSGSQGLKQFAAALVGFLLMLVLLSEFDS